MLKHIKHIFHLIALLVLISSPFTTSLLAQDQAKFPTSAKISLLRSISFPQCVAGYRLDMGKSQKLSEVMTTDGIYSIDSNFHPYLLINRECSKAESQNCSPPVDVFSPYGEIAIENVIVSDETFNTFLVNLSKKSRSLLKDSSGGAVFSSISFLILDAVSRTCDLLDFNGTLIRSFGGSEAFRCAKAHKNGFVGFGPGFHFIDSSGKYLKHIPYHSYGLNYDVDFETGITAILVPFSTSSKPREESMIYLHDHQGNLITQFKIPFTDTAAGIGLSPGGDYVAVLSKLGWVKLFDIKNNKQLWTKDFNWGHLFASWRSPIPVSSSGEYVIVHGDTREINKDLDLFLVFDRSGNLIGHIDSPVSREHALKCKVAFIQGMAQFLLIHDNTISLYEIQKGE